MATTDGLTLATASATLGRGGDWLLETDGIDASLLGIGVDSSDLAGVVVLSGDWLLEADGIDASLLGIGVDSSDLARVVVSAGAIGDGAVSVLGARAHPVARAREKIRLRATTKCFIFILFMVNSILARR
jgi:hypothetical protein